MSGYGPQQGVSKTLKRKSSHQFIYDIFKPKQPKQDTRTSIKYVTRKDANSILKNNRLVKIPLQREGEMPQIRLRINHLKIIQSLDLPNLAFDAREQKMVENFLHTPLGNTFQKFYSLTQPSDQYVYDAVSPTYSPIDFKTMKSDRTISLSASQRDNAILYVFIQKKDGNTLLNVMKHPRAASHVTDVVLKKHNTH
jgi:hypothetical protein